jgi:APA family basic amino acid/polyamine antiporter
VCPDRILGQDLDEILSFTIFLDCFGMVLSAATIFILRKRGVGAENKSIYAMKLYPLMPIIFIAAYVFVACSIFIDKPLTGATGLAILAAFIALFFLVKKMKKQTS